MSAQYSLHLICSKTKKGEERLLRLNELRERLDIQKIFRSSLVERFNSFSFHWLIKPTKERRPWNQDESKSSNRNCWSKGSSNPIGAPERTGAFSPLAALERLASTVSKLIIFHFVRGCLSASPTAEARILDLASGARHLANRLRSLRIWEDWGRPEDWFMLIEKLRFASSEGLVHAYRKTALLTPLFFIRVKRTKAFHIN